MNTLETYLKFALKLIDQADQIAMAYYKHDLEVQYKNDRTPVTEADREIEAFLRCEIEKKYSGHEILGEEFGEGEFHSGYRWIIDPIDGTKSFMRSIPTFAILLGLEIDGEVKLGIASFPALNERIYAIEGKGTWWQQDIHSPPRRACVSGVTKLKNAMVMTTDVSKMKKHGKAKSWKKIQEISKSCLGYGDAYGYMLVATGRAELMLDPIMSVWDCGPLPVLMNEAGAYFGDWHGKKTIYASESLATSIALFDEVMAITALDKG